MRLVMLLSLLLSAAVHAADLVEPSAMSATVKVLASDEFEGRAPGTPGETKTVAYLIERFKALGLQPAGEQGGWTQKVPLLRTQITALTDLAIEGLGDKIQLAQGQQVSATSLTASDTVAISQAPMVFVGYGVTAPERGWDDFKGLDLTGKVAVFLVNDPDFEALPDEPVYGKFGGQAMTYFGRWPYKFAEAERRGAVAALIVHEAPGAGYGWSTVIASNGEAYDLVRGPKDAKPLALQSWLQRDVAVEMFRRAGLDFEAQKRAARRADFQPVALGAARLSGKIALSHVTVDSQNLLARIPGTRHPDETIFYGAHWDAYGIGAPDAKGDKIRRGANDDGLGVAGLLEIARLFKQGPAPDRSVVFGLWTAEERGLLGSKAYAEHPLFPLAKTAANYTLDILQTAGLARDVVLVGAGQNSLEADLAQAAKGQNRVVTPDSHPEKGLFYRADHFSFAQKGVPTLLIMAMGGGADLVAGGRAAGDRWIADYTNTCYHKACDAWSADWDLRGAAQDVELIYHLGRDLAASRAWPDWSDSSEFKAIRAQSRSERGQ